jgi:hypothetical protein
MRFSCLLAAALACTATPLAAESTVKLGSAVYIERSEPALGGGTIRKIEPASTLRRGDRVVLAVEWDGPRRGTNFTVTSPVPRTLHFQRSSEREQEVSVDGGKNWGLLKDLRIGNRHATPEDVTHIRWHVSRNDAAMGTGRFTYSAIVR